MQMKNKKYNFPRIVQRLCVERYAPVPEWNWLRESWQEPDQFWQELFEYYSELFPTPPKSYPFERYDFYHDIVIRNLADPDRIAFRWYEDDQWQQVSYADLHELTSLRLQHWQQHGLEPEKVLCIVLPMGLEYLATLMTALRSGLQVSCLPPLGRRFLARRLETLAPDYIVCDPLFADYLGEFGDILTGDVKSSVSDEYEGSYTYSSGAVLGNFFSPLSEFPELPRPLSCNEAYLYALRDGLFAFNHLLPGDHFAAPDFHLLQYQPCFLLSTLLWGATYIHITCENIEHDPDLLKAFSLKTLGVSVRLRDLMIKLGKGPITGCNHWFKNPAGPLDWQKWEAFIEKFALQEVAGSNIVMDASSGGALLFSAYKKGVMHISVFPSLGVPWQLTDFNLSGQNIDGDNGLFMAANCEDSGKPLGLMILARQLNEWAYLGNLEPKRFGHTYPRQEIEECLQGLSFIKNCAVLAVPQGGGTQRYDFLLQVFVGYVDNLDAKEDEWRTAIENAIASHLGAEFYPDRIKFYPLYAREIEEGVVDYAWCTSQYFSGYLHRKPEQNLYKLLTELRDLTMFEPH